MRTKHSHLVILLLTIFALACQTPPNIFQAIFPPPPVTQYPLAPTSVTRGLEELDSYRSQLTMDFNGSRNGETVGGHIEAITGVTQQPPARQHTLKIEGHLAETEIPVGVSEFVRFDDQIYLKKAGDNLWSQFTAPDSAPGELGFLELERLVTLPLTVTTPPLTETLRGLTVQHYRFSEADLTHPNLIFDQAQGEVWVATPGDYVVQYVISASLKVSLPDPGTHIFDQGQLSLHYALTDVEADFTIAPPADTVPTNNTLANLPRLPEAEIQAVFPNLIEYTSATTPISATLFYQSELSGLDWTEENAAIFEEKARLSFSKAGQVLTIIITPAGDPQKIKVVLDLTPGQK